MDNNTPINSPAPSVTKNTFSNIWSKFKKNKTLTLIISILIIVIVGVAGYFLIKNKVFDAPKHIYTEEEKLQILQNLRVQAPEGSTPLSTDQKLSILKTLNKGTSTTTKSTTTKKAPIVKPISEEEKAKIINSVN
jgi:predicted PurR-regulated permease PerM